VHLSTRTHKRYDYISSRRKAQYHWTTFNNLVSAVIWAPIQEANNSGLTKVTACSFGWWADGWCWFVLREKYCWLVAGGWFVLREKYCWLVADKSSEQGEFVIRITVDSQARH
jgi:hypothetical protein